MVERITKGKGSSIFSLDVHGRDDLRYGGKKLSDPINTAEVYCFSSRISGDWCRHFCKQKV
jgi:hypothetical protein